MGLQEGPGLGYLYAQADAVHPYAVLVYAAPHGFRGPPRGLVLLAGSSAGNSRGPSSGQTWEVSLGRPQGQMITPERQQRQGSSYGFTCMLSMDPMGLR
eukprot:3153112-Pyramimonas_sp.AAC.1